MNFTSQLLPRLLSRLLCCTSLLSFSLINTVSAQTSCPTGAALQAKFNQVIKYGQSMDPVVAAGILIWNEQGAAAISSWRNEVRPKVLYCYGTKCDLTAASTEVMQRLSAFHMAQYQYQFGMEVPVLPAGLDRPPREIFDWATRLSDCTTAYRPAVPVSTSGTAVASSQSVFQEPSSIERLRASIQPYKNYPFVAVPRGTLWQPTRFKTDYLAIPSLSFLPAADLAARNEFRRLVGVGQGAEALTYAVRIVPTLVTAILETEIVPLYQQGKAGVLVDPEQALYWLERAAEKEPRHYQRLGDLYRTGDGVSANPAMAAHYYSKGLSRGCAACFAGLKTAYLGGVAIPMEQMVDYAAFATEIGDREALDMLYDFLSEPSAALLARAPRVKALRDRAIALAGAEQYLRVGLAAAVFEQYRSGFVHDRVVLGGEKAVNGDPVGAVNLLTDHTSQGRYYKLALRAALTNRTSQSGKSLKDSAKRFVVLEGARWGDLSLSLAAAAILSTAGETYMDRESDSSNKLIEFSKRDLAMAAAYLSAAKQLGQPLPVAGAFKLAEAQGLNLAHRGVVSRAKTCVKAAKEKKDDYWFVVAFKQCAPLMDQVWDLTYLVDAYPLSSFDFQRLYRGEARIAQERAAIAASVQRQREVHRANEAKYTDRYAPTFYYSNRTEFEYEIRRQAAADQFWSEFFAKKNSAPVTVEVSIADYSRARNAKIAQVNRARSLGALDNANDPACRAPMMQTTSYCKAFDASPY